jgi:hypothetical protein
VPKVRFSIVENAINALTLTQTVKVVNLAHYQHALDAIQDFTSQMELAFYAQEIVPLVLRKTHVPGVMMDFTWFLQTILEQEFVKLVTRVV